MSNTSTKYRIHSNNVMPFTHLKRLIEFHNSDLVAIKGNASAYANDYGQVTVEIMELQSSSAASRAQYAF